MTKIKEWWSIIRIDSCGGWIEVAWKDQVQADNASAEMMSKDPTIICIHRSKTKPDTERACGNLLEKCQEKCVHLCTKDDS